MYPRSTALVPESEGVSPVRLKREVCVKRTPFSGESAERDKVSGESCKASLVGDQPYVMSNCWQPERLPARKGEPFDNICSTGFSCR